MLERIDERVDSRCMTDTMNKQGCSVPTNDAPTPFRVIDLDHSAAPVKPSARKCDYLFLAADNYRPGLLVVPLELKSTGLNPAGVESQLQAGAGVAEQIARGSRRSGSFQWPCTVEECIGGRIKSCARSGSAFVA